MGKSIKSAYQIQMEKRSSWTMVSVEIAERLRVGGPETVHIPRRRAGSAARLLFCLYPCPMEKILARVTNPRLRAMLLLCQAEIPGFSIRFKDKSFFMKALYYVGFVWVFNKDFNTRFWTTTGKAVYAPTEEGFYADPEGAVGILAHELVHMIDRKKNGVLGHDLPYAFPQILAVLSLLSLGAIWNLWFLVFLVFLLALAPLPSPGRKNVEMRGYTMSMAVFYWRYATIAEEDFDWYAKHFSGPTYYFMWPWHKDAVKELKTRFEAVRSGSILLEPVFRKVYDIVKMP